MSKLTVAPGQPIEAAHVNSLSDNVCNIYQTTAERDSTEPTPDEGQLCYVVAIQRLQVYRAGGWVNVMSVDGGGGPLTADINFSGQKGTNLGEGTADNDTVRLDQATQRAYTKATMGFQSPDNWERFITGPLGQVQVGAEVDVVLPDAAALTGGVPLAVFATAQGRYNRQGLAGPEIKMNLRARVLFNSGSTRDGWAARTSIDDVTWRDQFLHASYADQLQITNPTLTFQAVWSQSEGTGPNSVDYYYVNTAVNVLVVMGSNP